MTSGNTTPQERPGALSRRTVLARGSAYAGGLLAATAGLAGCGTDRGNPSEVSWSTWGNPGEIGRFKEFTADFNRRMDGTTARLVPVPSDNYLPRLLTQLGGGTATDAFYVYDRLIATLIKSKLILPLNERLAGPRSRSPADNFFDSTWGSARTADGTIYGVPVDCNPHVIWYNIDVLRRAGVTTMPAELYEQGRWTMDAFDHMARQVHRKGMRAGAFLDGSSEVQGWMRAGGGTIYDDGKWVVPDDPRATETFEWMVDLMRSGAFVYAGALPEGQGQDALFMSNKLAFCVSVGRWVLPVFRENKDLKYDIVPYPSVDGSLSSVHVAVAYLVINAEAKDPDRAFDFLTRFVSGRGQRFRLQGQGNAVPSISGADEVLTDKTVPHADYFVDSRKSGYALFREEASVLGLDVAIKKKVGTLFSQGGDPKETLRDMQTMINQAVKNGSLA